MCNDGFVWMNPPPEPQRPQPVREERNASAATAPAEPLVTVLETRWTEEAPEPTLAEIGEQLQRWVRRRVRAIPGWVIARMAERLSPSL